MTWEDGHVSTQASIVVGHSVSGAKLRDGYAEAVAAVTLGLARVRHNSVVIGPLTLLRFGQPKVTRNSVDWPIEGGLLARRAGGHWRVLASGGRVEATVTGYAPRLPRFIYTLSHLQVHLLFTRLYLLRVRGREPAPGVPAAARDRFQAGSIDVAFCLTLAGLVGRRRLRHTLAIAAAYHVACWSIWGRTFGGLVMRQRVVAVDGSRLTPAQSLLRFALLPGAWLTRRPVHDAVAGTEVIAD